MSKVPLISLFLHNGREERGRMLHLERCMGAGKPPASWRLLPCLSPSFRAAGLRDYMMSLLLSVFVSFLCYLTALLLSFSWLFFTHVVRFLSLRAETFAFSTQSMHCDSGLAAWPPWPFPHALWYGLVTVFHSLGEPLRTCKTAFLWWYLRRQHILLLPPHLSGRNI